MSNVTICFCPVCGCASPVDSDTDICLVCGNSVEEECDLSCDCSSCSGCSNDEED